MRRMFLLLEAIALATLFGCGGGSGTMAQYEPATLEGTVVLTDSSEKAAGAVVEVGRARTVTAPDGKFQLRGLAAGKRTVAVRKSGYAATAKRVALKPGETKGVGKLKLSPEDDPPVVENIVVPHTRIERGKTLEATVVAEDPDGGELSYEWKIDAKKWSLKKKTASTRTVTVQAPSTSSSATVG